MYKQKNREHNFKRKCLVIRVLSDRCRYYVSHDSAKCVCMCVVCIQPFDSLVCLFPLTISIIRKWGTLTVLVGPESP